MARKAKDEAARVLPDQSEIKLALKSCASAWSTLQTAKSRHQSAMKAAKEIGLDPAAISKLLKGDPTKLLSDLEVMQEAARYARIIGRDDMAAAMPLFEDATTRMRDLVETPLLAGDDDDEEEEEPAAAKPTAKPATKHKGDGVDVRELQGLVN